MEDKATYKTQGRADPIVGISTEKGTHRIKESTLLACLRGGLVWVQIDCDRAIDALGPPDYDPEDPDPPSLERTPEMDAIDELFAEIKRIEAAIAFIKPPEPSSKQQRIPWRACVKRNG